MLIRKNFSEKNALNIHNLIHIQDELATKI